MIGGNLAGILLKHFSLGMAGNTLAGIVGGSLCGQLLSLLDIGVLSGSIGQLLSGGAGGAALMVVAGVLRQRSVS